MDLSLDNDSTAKFLCSLPCLLGRGCQMALRDGNSIRPEQLFCLIFVDVHMFSRTAFAMSMPSVRAFRLDSTALGKR